MAPQGTSVGTGQSARMDPAGPLIISTLALLGAAAAGSVAGYGIYEVIAGPPQYHDPSVEYSYSFQLVGCLGLLVPLVAATVLLAMTGALLLRYRSQLIGGTAPSAAGLVWAQRAKSLVLGGYVPGIVAVVVVGAADQLCRTPRTTSTVAGGAAGAVGFLAGWAGLRRALGQGWRLPLARAFPVGVAVAGLLAGAAFTRVQDEENLLLGTGTPVAAGFHYLSASARPSVRFMMVACASARNIIDTYRERQQAEAQARDRAPTGLDG